MQPKLKIPAQVLIGLLLAIVIDTVLQILWKFAAIANMPADYGGVLSFAAGFLHPIFLGVGLLLVLQLLNWIKVLSGADLSYAQPITALSYISVVIASAIFLDEDVTLRKLLGIGVILTGVWLISRTDHRTDPPPLPSPTRPGG